MEERAVSVQTIRRLPVYLRYLQEQSGTTVSAASMAKAFGLNAVQVRKDLAAVSECGGRSGVGYETQALARDIRRFLGCDHARYAVLAGAGNLGQALMGYGGFAACGMQLCAALDTNPSLVGREIHGVPVYSPDCMEEICGRWGVEIGVLAVPAGVAQRVCDRMVDCGVRAIWNFVPEHLNVPRGVRLQNENLAASLVVLSKRLKQQRTGQVKE